jgi:hypothetical protein
MNSPRDSYRILLDNTKNIIRPPSIHGDKQMCEHIVKVIEQEREEQKAVDTHRNLNRIQLLNTLQRRHEACDELQRRAGVKRIKAMIPNTTITNPVEEEQQMNYNTSRECSTVFGEPKIIKKLKEARPVLNYLTE